MINLKKNPTKAIFTSISITQQKYGAISIFPVENIGKIGYYRLQLEVMHVM
jgi:hypothetical protein